MSSVTRADIPSQIITVEQYVAWGGLLLHRLNPTLRVLENENTSEYAASAATFAAADNTERLLLRINLKLDPNWQSSANKLWSAVQELSNTTVPSSYLN